MPWRHTYPDVAGCFFSKAAAVNLSLESGKAGENGLEDEHSSPPPICWLSRRTESHSLYDGLVWLKRSMSATQRYVSSCAADDARTVRLTFSGSVSLCMCGTELWTPDCWLKHLGGER
ncbi:hypothetical protein VZT92_017983 [Zoarces viviparus]|uniref:Uncharacterized protein n=1 Tax=Zoarces viviparus TaxID=48416 RepID=A0AAW1EP01_ZOAVI